MEQVERSPYYQTDTPEAVHENSSGQDILNDFAARQGTIFASLAQHGRPNSINQGNKEEVQKAFSYIYNLSMVESNIYKNRVTQIDNLTSLEADGSQYNNSGYPVRTVDRESKTGDVFGQKTKYINAHDNTGDVSQYIFTYTPFTDIHGEERHVWQLKQIPGEGYPLYVADVEGLFN